MHFFLVCLKLGTVQILYIFSWAGLLTRHSPPRCCAYIWADISRHGKGYLDAIQFFHSRFQPQAHSWGFLGHHTRLPVPNNSTHILSCTHHTHSPHPLSLSPVSPVTTQQNRLFVYDPLKKKKELQNTAANIKEKCWSYLGSGLFFLGGGRGGHTR